MNTRQAPPSAAHHTAMAVFATLAVCAAAPVWADDGQRIASEQGCLNCHGSQSRNVPTLGQLAEKIKRKGGTAEAQQHMLDEIREHGSVHTHRMVSDDAALAVVRWLAQQGK